MIAAVAMACLLACAVGQETSPGMGQPAPTTSAGASDVSETRLSVISLFLPMGGPSRIQASVISASPNETAYALGCMSNANVSDCGYATPITVTEGESTVIFTNTYGGEETTMTANPLTVQCVLSGATVKEIPIVGATAAVCTGRSAIPGLGFAVSTSTLARTEINYVPVTITAGVDKIIAAATMVQAPPTTTSNAGNSGRKTMAGLGVGGALGILVVGFL